MRHRPFTYGIVCLLATGLVRAAAAPDGLSPLGRQVYASRAGQWFSLTGTVTTVHALEAAPGQAALREAEQAYAAAGRALNLTGTAARIQVFLIDDARWWEDIVATNGLRPDGLAMQLESDMVLLMDGLPTHRPDRLAHEMVHVRLRQEISAALPLWLEEGLALYLGKKIAGRTATAAMTGRGRPLSEVLARTAYPVEAGEASVYYAQVEVLITRIAARLGDAQLPGLMEQVVAHGGDLQQVLMKKYAYSGSEWQELKNRVIGASSNRLRSYQKSLL